MQQHYGVDLCDLWRGRLTLRKLRVLIDNLPPDSRTAYAVAGHRYDPLAGWSLHDLLLGRLVDEFGIYRWQWEAAHLDRKSQTRKQPPSVLPELRRTATPAGDTVPVLSPHRLGAFVNDPDLEV